MKIAMHTVTGAPALIIILIILALIIAVSWPLYG